MPIPSQPAPSTGDEATPRAAAEALVRAYYAAFNAGDRAAMCALLDGDVAHDVNQGGRRTGLAAFKAFMAQMDAAYEERLEDLLVMAVNVDAQGSISSGSSLYSNVFDQNALTELVTLVPGTNSQYLGSELSNTNIAILSTDNSSDAPNSNSQALIGAGINTSADGYLVQTSLFTPAGSQVQSIQSAVVQERPASLTLSSDQTSSTLIPVGDLNGDGYADLLVTANNVLVQTGVNSQSLGTGLRLISGAGSSSQILSGNNPTLPKQAVQVAASFSLGGSTPVAMKSTLGAVWRCSTCSSVAAPCL
jgi:hypothetical protein